MNSLLSQLGYTSAAALGSVGNEDESQMSGMGLSIAALQAELAQSEAEKGIMELSNLSQGFTSLHNIQDRLAGLVSHLDGRATDGVTQSEALLVSRSVADINNEFGMELAAMPAVESYGDRISACHYTSVGAEAADKGLDKVWAFIIDTINKLKDMVAKWWDKFFGDVEGLKKYAEKVKASAAGYKADKEDKKITITGRTLYVGDSKPNAGSIKLNMEKSAKATKEFILKQTTTAEAVTDALVKCMEASDGTKDKQLAAVTELSKNAELVKFINASHLGSGAKAEAPVYGVGLPGGKTVTITNPLQAIPDLAETAGRAEFLNAISKLGYKITTAKESKDTKDLTIDRLSQSEVEAIADSAIELADDILAMRKSRTDSRKYSEEVLKGTKAVKKAAEDLEDANKASKAELTAMSKAAISTLQEAVGGTPLAWTSHMVSIAKASLKAATASV